MYIPSCDEDGYYRKVQCDQSRGECWCVDQHGGEMMGTRIHGNPDCGKRDGGLGKHIFSQCNQHDVSYSQSYVLSVIETLQLYFLKNMNI
ncbi:Testican-2 [Dissostichus eleginoides]|uniref:Testican-2 n=1 Tax=Dissostichus eleginoides TaxID=100907 RepID=A0AAD9BE70_DISEL|nr:Testican-2 [Dissostichus eleginoides]